MSILIFKLSLISLITTFINQIMRIQVLRDTILEVDVIDL